ncbi:hypothetical protein BIW11_10899 [Tropilaelaps mercedesae]|uniref:Uncharacterized protein n=1 Tax=Tropilaelaps mercedesae TaxID=418985 RepID=A0A1V9XDJ4_9ACAR|nr:hypothetical protein BIW11_10899 [Tropilaelaps mercedesae]
MVQLHLSLSGYEQRRKKASFAKPRHSHLYRLAIRKVLKRTDAGIWKNEDAKETGTIVGSRIDGLDLATIDALVAAYLYRAAFVLELHPILCTFNGSRSMAARSLRTIQNGLVLQGLTRRVGRDQCFGVLDMVVENAAALADAEWSGE